MGMIKAEAKFEVTCNTRYDASVVEGWIQRELARLRNRLAADRPVRATIKVADATVFDDAEEIVLGGTYP